MASPSYIVSPQGRRLAYHLSPGAAPGVVFLGGYGSDMEGTKATHLEAWARARGRAYLRLDYGGHGSSGAVFEDCTIGSWAEDAAAVIGAATQGPQVLVGSSMGGWIALLLIRAGLVDCAGLVTVAAAPDFTEDGFWAGFDEATRARIMTEGAIELPSLYCRPYTITRALIEDGRRQLVLRSPLSLPMPVRFLQGTADPTVSVATALQLLAHADGPDMRLTLLKGGDHSLSDPVALAMLEAAIAEVLGE